MVYRARSLREKDKERLIQWARARYVAEEISLEEFEKRVERILHGRASRAPVKPKYPANPKRSFV